MELGSGLGMLGLSICKKCHVKKYTFTDCHTHVLNLLASNIHTNTSDTEETVQTQCVKRARRSYEEDVHSTHVDCETSGSSASPDSHEKTKSVLEEGSASNDLCNSVASSDSAKCGSGMYGANSLERNEHLNEELHLDSAVWRQVTEDQYQYKSDSKLSLCKLDWEHVAHSIISKFDTDVILAAGEVLQNRTDMYSHI